MPHRTALITLFAIALYFATGLLVARARRTTGIKPPATTGHPDFERAYRTQLNTLEWLPIFLASLWLAALYVSDAWASVIGAAWIIGRVLYIRGYAEAAEKRHLGFAIQAFASVALWLIALCGVIAALLQ